jgi:hypothetical protein
MFSVCHLVILVQDWFLDMNLMRLLQAAETLKPVTPTGLSGALLVMLKIRKCQFVFFNEPKILYCTVRVPVIVGFKF